MAEEVNTEKTEFEFIDPSVSPGEDHKWCSTNKHWALRTDFSTRKASKDGLSYTCKTCERVVAQASYDRRKATKQAQKRQRAYYDKNRDKLLEQSAANYQANRERRLDLGKTYRAAHPEVHRQSGKRRRMLVKAAQVPGVRYSRQDIIIRDSINGVPMCVICNTPIVNINEIQVDHRIPINQGGLDIPENVRTVHRTCNLLRPKDGRDLTVEEARLEVAIASEGENGPTV